MSVMIDIFILIDMYPSYGTWTEDFQPNNFMIKHNYFTSLGSYWERAIKFIPTEVRKLSIRTGIKIIYLTSLICSHSYNYVII